MTQQFGFCFDPGPEMPCAFGRFREAEYRQHCRDCEAETERLCAAFADFVAAGKFYASGFEIRKGQRCG